MEKLKEALKTFVAVAEKSDEALVDGKINIAEGVNIAMSAIGLVFVAKNWKEIKDEYLALTPPESDELSAWFASEFDIIDDNLEAIIELIIGIFLQLGDVFEKLNKK